MNTNNKPTGSIRITARADGNPRQDFAPVSEAAQRAMVSLLRYFSRPRWRIAKILRAFRRVAREARRAAGNER